MTDNEAGDNAADGGNDRHGAGRGTPQDQGGWQPVPYGGEYDAEATAFVQLPPEDGSDAPLAAPGHGYVPPMITPLLPDPAVAGTWALPDPQAHEQPPAQEGFPDPYGEGPYGQDAQQHTRQEHTPQPHDQQPPDQHTQGGLPHSPQAHDLHAPDPGPRHPGATGHWDFTEALGGTDPGIPPAPHVESTSETTGQWRIPLATGEALDESGELSAALRASPWNGGTPPATLPGGARAPWATDPEPEEAPAAPKDVQHAWAPTADAVAGNREADGPEADHAAEALGGPRTAEPVSLDPVPEAAPGLPEPAQETGHTAERDAADHAVPESFPGPESLTAHDPFAVPESRTAHDAFTEPEPAVPLSSSNDSAEHPGCSYVLRVNGSDRPVTDAWIGESLLYVLRERLGLAGAKDGCSQGECGACNVQVDGRLVASCLVPAATAAGSEVRTVEGLAVDGEPSDVQRALAARGSVQCGFCIPGMAMTVHDLLEGNHAPNELETRQALSGNLCRCSGYRGVLEAVSEVVAGRVASAEAAAAVTEEARVPHQAPPGAGGAQLPQANDGGMA